jgi:hypothetical protein
MSVAHDARGRGYGGADSHGKRWAKCGHGMNLRRSGSLPALPVLPQSSSIRSAATNAPPKEVPDEPVPTIEQERERCKRNEPDRNLLRSRSIRLKMAVTVGFEPKCAAVTTPALVLNGCTQLQSRGRRVLRHSIRLHSISPFVHTVVHTQLRGEARRRIGQKQPPSARGNAKPGVYPSTMC